MAVKILQHAPSNGAKELANALGIKRLRCTGSKWKPKTGDTVINWGSSTVPDTLKGWLHAKPVFMNIPNAVHVAASKLNSLTNMKEAGVNVPEFTQDRSVAAGWLSDGHSVIARALDRGSAGRGITFHEKGSDPSALPSVPLFTRYEPRKYEYRLHVFRQADGTYSVVDAAQKRKKSGVEDANFKVRTHDNGWVYCREGIEIPDGASEQARTAVQALGLDFGAVDTGYTCSTKRTTVFEVNTAPGLEGSTIARYAEAMKELIYTSV